MSNARAALARGVARGSAAIGRRRRRIDDTLRPEIHTWVAGVTRSIRSGPSP
jgi:hypothetical protein